MSTYEPSREARLAIGKLLVQVIDFDEMPLHQNMAGAEFVDPADRGDEAVPPEGMIRPDGTVVLPENVGRAFESPGNALAYRQAIHAVTVAALDKRIEGRY
ncbi:MAG TPA: hypothetical protein VG497_13335, partial [Kribbella sp.]|nr:hypothetical protein [Kribbella sp.]